MNAVQTQSGADQSWTTMAESRVNRIAGMRPKESPIVGEPEFFWCREFFEDLLERYGTDFEGCRTVFLKQ